MNKSVCCTDGHRWRENPLRTWSLILLACVVSCGAGSPGPQSPTGNHAHDEAVAADISCRAGNPDGCRLLAWAWRNGTGVPKNEVLADQFEQRAAQLEAQAKAAAAPPQQQPDPEGSRTEDAAKEAERVRAAEVAWRKNPVKPFSEFIPDFRATLTAFGIDTTPYEFVKTASIKQGDFYSESVVIMVSRYVPVARVDEAEVRRRAPGNSDYNRDIAVRAARAETTIGLYRNFINMLQRDFITVFSRFEKWASTEQIPFGDEPTDKVIEQQYELSAGWTRALERADTRVRE